LHDENGGSLKAGKAIENLPQLGIFSTLNKKVTSFTSLRSLQFAPPCSSPDPYTTKFIKW
jgi:hypothetical protein